MPQGHRSVAFSNKQKKEQLKSRRERKQHIVASTSECLSNQSVPNISFSRKDKFHEIHLPVPPMMSTHLEEIESIPSKNSRYNLKFRKEQISRNQHHQYEPITLLPDIKTEEDISNFYPSGLDYPKRPPWKKNITKTELDHLENRYFRHFCEQMDKKYQAQELSRYELNLETWRQLWRVTEMADLLLIIVDVRFVVAQFPPYLYHNLVEKEGKGIVLVLNKCDLVSPALILAWQDYFELKFPGLRVVPFCSIESNSLQKRTNLKMAYRSARKLAEVCQQLVNNGIDLSSWQQKIEEDGSSTSSFASKCDVNSEPETSYSSKSSADKRKDDILTIGTIGHPNVGKSSLINALMGKKVVSVSRTPGHTKHFQTIFLTKNLRLCDCPGLVFPSLCPKPLQVVLGSYPIAQVRDVVSNLTFVAERIDIPKLLKLEPPNLDADIKEEFRWSPYDICEAWATKRRYFTRTKGGKPDVSRAANEILRFTLVGFKSLVLSLKPPKFSCSKDSYMNDPRQEEIKLIQGIHAAQDPSTKFVRDPKKADESESDSYEDTSDEESTQSDESSSRESTSDEGSEIVPNDNKFSLLNSAEFNE